VDNHSPFDLRRLNHWLVERLAVRFDAIKQLSPAYQQEGFFRVLDAKGVLRQSARRRPVSALGPVHLQFVVPSGHQSVDLADMATATER
jgi:hypothetical protein